MANEIPELLFHTTLEVVDDHRAEGFDGSHQVYVLGTYGSLEAARELSSGAFEALGYKSDDFTTYEVHAPGQDWPYGDGILVFAQTPSGQQFKLGIYTTFNEEELAVTPNGVLILPTGSDHLHYVLQTTLDYNQDRSGAAQSTEIVGTFLLRKTALNAAKTCLQDDKDRFVQYEERDSPQMNNEWPYGEDVIVHAIAETGENVYVSLKTPPRTHKKHGQKTCQPNFIPLT